MNEFELPLSMAGSRALLIGVSNYTDLPCVESANRSARDFANLLIQRCGLAPPNLTLLQDPASVATIGSNLVSVSEEATDVLLVYFVGHGLVHGSGELYLAHSDTISQPGQVSYTGLRYANVRETLLGSRASSIYVIVDCCFAGRAIGALSSGHTLDRTRVDGACVLAAAARDEIALAPPGAEHTAFTGELITLMRDGDPKRSEFLTVRDIFRYLSATLEAKGHPSPRMLENENASDLIFCRNAAERVTSDGRVQGGAHLDRPKEFVTSVRSDPELGQLVKYGGWEGFNPLPQALLEVDSRVPRTSEQLADLLSDRPPVWEHRLFAGVALQELARLRPSFAVHFNGPFWATGDEWSSQATFKQHIDESLDRYIQVLSHFSDVFENGRHRRILESKDPDQIKSHAVEIVALTEQFMSISADLRGVRIKNRHLRRAINILAHFPDQSIVSIVELIQEYVSSVDESGRRAMDGEDMNITLQVKVEIPDVLQRQFRDAIGRY